jgi:hypothetical protein
MVIIGRWANTSRLSKLERELYDLERDALPAGDEWPELIGGER